MIRGLLALWGLWMVSALGTSPVFAFLSLFIHTDRLLTLPPSFGFDFSLLLLCRHLLYHYLLYYYLLNYYLLYYYAVTIYYLSILYHYTLQRPHRLRF